MPSLVEIESLETVCPGEKVAEDLHKNPEPLGRLTRVGMSQLWENGQKFKRHLREHYECDPNEANYEVFCSRYSRTRQSAQCFVQGLELDGRAGQLAELKVEDPKDPFINVWDNKHAEVQPIVDRVIGEPKYVEKEWNAGPLSEAKAVISKAVPAFQDLSLNEGRWSRAYDYLMTRRAHGTLWKYDLNPFLVLTSPLDRRLPSPCGHHRCARRSRS